MKKLPSIENKGKGTLINPDKLKRIASKNTPLAFIVMLIVLWQLISDNEGIPKYILPSPIDIGKVVISILPDLKTHALTTLGEAILGLAISVVVSLVLAIIMDNINIVKKTLYPILIVSQTIPIIALAPLFIIWFGFGIMPKILVVVLVCFFPIVISLVDGLASVDKDLLDLMQLMKASRLKIFRHIKLPSAIVNFFSGLRIAVTYSIMGAVIGEWLGGEKGLGVYMMRVKHSYALDKFFAAILVIVVLSVTLFRIITIIEYYAIPWKRRIR